MFKWLRNLYARIIKPTKMSHLQALKYEAGKRGDHSF